MLMLLVSADFFKINSKKNYFRITIRVSNGFDPDQDGYYVGPDLGPNCLQRLSADDMPRVLTHSLNEILRLFTDFSFTKFHFSLIIVPHFTASSSPYSCLFSSCFINSDINQIKS